MGHISVDYERARAAVLGQDAVQADQAYRQTRQEVQADQASQSIEDRPAERAYRANQAKTGEQPHQKTREEAQLEGLREHRRLLQAMGKARRRGDVG